MEHLNTFLNVMGIFACVYIVIGATIALRGYFAGIAAAKNSKFLREQKAETLRRVLDEK